MKKNQKKSARLSQAKLFLFIAVFMSLIANNLHATVYYVSLSGNDLNNGTSITQGSGNIGPWRTLTHAGLASTNLQPGDIVHVQAGEYLNEQVVFSRSGTATNPISFIGYKTVPNDAPAALAPTATATTIFNTANMPTYTGTSRAAGTGFNCENQKYLVFRNFQIRNYDKGLFAGGSSQDAGNLILDNINIMTIGDILANYSGVGFAFGSKGTKFSNNNTLTNCLVINAAAEGFGINGNNNSFTNCKVFCNENDNRAATDYYMVVCGSYNTFTNCYVDKGLNVTTHTGHGLGAKTNAGDGQTLIPAQYNNFYYCEAKNMGESFYVRHRSAQYNLFYHCKATGTHTGDPGSSEGGGRCIVTRDGASNNTFDGCIAENCNAAITFSDSQEDGGTTPHPGNNNKYVNCTFTNCYYGVKFAEEDFPNSDAGDNTIANCTFYKTRYLHYVASHCTKMKYIGNIYYGCLPATPGSYFKGNLYPSEIQPNGTDTYFKQCNFINIQNMPAGYVGINGNISSDPLFINAPTNFRLPSNSPCVDQVDAITLAFNPTDFDGVARYKGVKSDMGAFEYTPIEQRAINTVGLLPSTLICGEVRDIEFTTAGVFSPGTIFTAQLSDANGSFASPTVMGTGQSSPIHATLSPIPTGSNYKIRVCALSTSPNPIIGSIVGPFSTALSPGDQLSNAIDIGLISCNAIYSDIRNSSNCYANDYDASTDITERAGQVSKDIYYKFRIDRAENVVIKTCNTTFKTYVHLLDGTGNQVISDNGNGTTFSCPTISGSITRALSPGIYYVVVEGNSTINGEIKLEITAKQGLKFTDPTDQIVIPANAGLNFGTGGFTLEATITLSTTNPASVILSNRTSTTNGYVFGTAANGRLKLQLNGVDIEAPLSTINLHDGRCHHVAAARYGVDYIRLYVDGVRVLQAQSTANVTAGVTRIGYDVPTTSSLYGGIRNVRIWNAGLAEGTIIQQAGLIISVPNNNLRGHWRLLDGPEAGQNVVDFSGSNLTGKLGTNSTAVDISDPTYECSAQCMVSGFTNNSDEINSVITNIESALKVYPNPFTQATTIVITGETEKASIEILDVNGKIVYKNENYITNEHITLGENFKSGFYILRVTTIHGTESLKLVKTE